MMVSPKTTKVAVLAGLAVGVVVTLASGELRAERDVELELLRANEALTERVTKQEAELAALRDAVAAAAGKPGASKPGPSAPGSAPKSKAEAEAEELAAFRTKVLNAVKPELEAIDARATASTEAFDKHVTAYAKHSHTYELTSNSWVKLDVMLTSDATEEILRPSYSDDWIAIRHDGQAGTYSKSTSKPK